MINHRTILSGVLVALTWQWPIEKYSCRNQEKSENEKNDHSNKVILKLVVVKGVPDETFRVYRVDLEIMQRRIFNFRFRPENRELEFSRKFHYNPM